jgi:hypothetical protein
MVRACIGKIVSSQFLLLGKLDIYIQKNETTPLPLSNYKNQLKLDWRLKVIPKIKKLLAKMLQYIEMGTTKKVQEIKKT